MRYKFIAVEGNIGAGKTTLASKLASAYNTNLILEEFEQNPFLPKFYLEPDKYALALELSFLAERFHQLIDEFKKGDGLRVSDYYFNKSFVFAQANLKKEEWNIFKKFFDIVEQQLQKPDLLIFLNPLTGKLKENIESRGRAYEQNIEMDYLTKIQRSYVHYLEKQDDLPVIMLEMQSTKYISSLDDFSFLDRLLQANYKKGINKVMI